jgi:SAM-dependent methyltransferase
VDRKDPAYRGQRDYNRAFLHLYNPIVFRVGKVVWHVPKSALLEPYRRYTSRNHLDVGPGTGYWLQQANFAPGSRVTILDPNRSVLRHVSRRLPGLDLTAVEADVLKPLPVAGPFDSAALSMVIHCLPGPMERKAPAIANIAAVLAPSGVLFGATVLGRSADHTPAARRVLAAFNRQGGFDNLDDSEAGLRDILQASFADVEVHTVGSAAIFVARNPKPRSGPVADRG